jgi:hypothetical protein
VRFSITGSTCLGGDRQGAEKAGKVGIDDHTIQRSFGSFVRHQRGWRLPRYIKAKVSGDLHCQQMMFGN